MKELVRAIGGLLTIVTLLALVIVDVVVDGASLSLEQLRLLVVLVGALLGLDIMLEKIPVTVDFDIDRRDDD